MLEAGDRVHRFVRPLLVVAHETGHRIGSIRQLRWEDVDLDGAAVTWEADRDKEEHSHTTPLTLAAGAALSAHRRASGTVGAGWVVASPAEEDQPCSRNLVRDWWERTAKLAKLPTGERFGWHSLRRNFASAMRDVAPRELIDLGGWASYDTPLKCYIRPDLEAQRGAFAQRRVLRANVPATEHEGVA
jgi:integrase